MENCNLDAEKSILSAMLNDNTLIEEVEINYEDFADQRLRYIYRVMKHLYSNGSKVDTISLTEYMQRAKKLEAVGGLLFLTEIDNFNPLRSGLQTHVEIVRELSLRRQLKLYGKNIVQQADDCENISQAIEEAQQKLLGITDVTGSKSPLPVDIVAEEYGNFLIENQGKYERGVATGITSLDMKTGGFKKGNFVVLAARPAMGKTALALNVAQKVAEKEPVLFVSLEMSKEELVDRLFRGYGYGEDLFGNDFAKYIRGIRNEISKLKLHIYDYSKATITDIRKSAKKLKHRYGNLGLIVIDYLQLMKSESRYDSRVQEVSELTRSLKILARELETPILALSQLSRMVETRQDKRPMLSDLRESGSIEQDADIVLMLYRDICYNKDANPNIAELILSKHRAGPIGTCNLFYSPNKLQFKSLDRRQEDFEDVEDKDDDAD